MLTLSLENFKCYIDKHTFTLGEHPTTLISGNIGAGKSTMFKAISWCLYGKEKRTLPWTKKTTKKSWVQVDDPRVTVLGTSISAPSGSSVTVKFRYSKQTADPTTGRRVTTVTDRTVLDPKRNPDYAVPAFDAIDTTTGTIKTFISSRVISIQSVDKT